jgi:putrescine transport system ATP-binding protein
MNEDGKRGTQSTPWRDPSASPYIRIEGLSKHFDGFAAVDGVDLEIYKGELFSILGGSGCGKTTLLRMLAGFERPSAGRIVLDGADITDVPPYERPINMMFQSYAVFPHMSVADNVAYGLRKEHLAARTIDQRVAEMLELVQLAPFARRKPDQLSGGQRQRVALARALVKRPKVLLLDEPLAALDKKLRQHTQFELMNIQDSLGVTFIVVTHDQEEAMTLSTRIAVMDRGRFAQIGTPSEIYEYPRTRFIADFIGTINLFEGMVLRCGDGDVAVRCMDAGGEMTLAHAGPPLAPQTPVWIAVRPEKIYVSNEPPEATARTVIKGVVWDLGYLGNHSIYRVKTDTGKMVQVSSQNRRRLARLTLEWDDEVYLSWDASSSVLLTE